MYLIISICIYTCTYFHVLRERKLYLERHSMCITCISRDIDICTYFYVLRERENILYHSMCIYIHVLISMLMKYYVLLYLIGFSNSICVITCTYVMCHST